MSAKNDLFDRGEEVDQAIAREEPRHRAELEKTIIIAAKAVIEALYKARY